MRALALIIVVGLVAACGRTEVVRYSEFPPVFDAGRPDAGSPDAGPPDAGPPDAGPFDAGPCMPRVAQVTPAVPIAVFVIDRSGSMNEDLDGNMDGGTTRWDVLESSLRAVLPPLDQQLAMGALMYPVQGQSCTAPSAVDLAAARGNASRLVNLFNSSSPLGGTPTAEALGVAATYLRNLRAASSARSMILATDGAPNCNPALSRFTCTCTSPPVLDPNCDAPTHCLDDRRTIDTIGRHFRENIPTYVIGLGSQLNMYASTLDAMAVAGGVPRTGPGPRYYSVTNQAELTDAFRRITSQLARCTFLVDGFNPDETFTVEVGGMVVPEGPTGWEWIDRPNRELALRGAACDQASLGASTRVLADCR